MRNVLTIAGSDSSGGAGIQADLKTFSAHGVFGMSVITAVTAQSTRGVFGVQDITPEMIEKQLEVLFEDIAIHAIKIGMVSKSETIRIISSVLNKHRKLPIVLDPVMVSKSGHHLLEPEAKEALIQHLLPLATVVTPNLPEAEVITGESVESLEEMKRAGHIIYGMGPAFVLMKGGHLEEEASTDLLFNGTEWLEYPHQRIETKNTHGTGCTLSASLAANLAKGISMQDSVKLSKDYITEAIQASFSIGKGPGPVHHFHQFYDNTGKVRQDEKN